MDKADPRKGSVGQCVFRSLSTPSRDASFDSATTGDGDGSVCFRPSCWSDNRDEGQADPLNGKDLAVHLEEVHQLAFQRGLDSGREEACRMAQASVLPHLKSLIQSLSGLIHQIQNAESCTSAHAVSLAGDIVERVMGVSSGSYDFEGLQNDLGQAVVKANQFQIRLNQEDWTYLKELSENERLAWPEHPCVVFQADAEIEKGDFQIQDTGDARETLDRHVARHFTSSQRPNTNPA